MEGAAGNWKKPSQELVEWRQCKYDKLGATRAAVTLLAHPMPEVQLEALQLLEVLLEVGEEREGLPGKGAWGPNGGMHGNTVTVLGGLINETADEETVLGG